MSIEGVVDRITGDQIDGWVYRGENHSEHLVVTVRLKGVNIGSSVANIYRADLEEANIGEGDHAYLVQLNRNISGLKVEDLTVLASSPDGESRELSLTPVSDTIPEENVSKDEAVSTDIQQRLGKALKYTLPYAEASDLLPPVGYPSDFVQEIVRPKYKPWIQGSAEAKQEMLLKDTSPIPHPHNREGYAEGNDLMYWLSGYADYRMLQSFAAEYGIQGGRYFDFGGATGRVFRHFALQSDAWDVWSCDFKISSVEFNLKYFPSSIRAFLNSYLPALPVPDGYFDLISACSVFTHMDETETGWLLELRRVLKIGGIACISIHSKDTWQKMTGDLHMTVARLRPDIVDQPTLPEGKTVVTFRDDDPYRCMVFHSDEYVQRNWGRFFEICEIRPLTLGLQAIVICRRID